MGRLKASLTNLSSMLSSTSSQIATLKTDVAGTVSGMREAVAMAAGAEGSVRASGGRIVEQMKAAGVVVREEANGIEDATRGLEERAFDALDRLTLKFKDSKNQWDEELKLQLAAVQAGAISIEDFLTRWGDALVQMADGGHQIRELLSGLDLNARTRELQDYIKGLQKGSVDLQDVAKFLADTGFSVAQQLGKMIESFDGSRQAIAELAAFIAEIQAKFSGSDFGDLAGELGRQIQEAQRSGELP